MKKLGAKGLAGVTTWTVGATLACVGFLAVTGGCGESGSEQSGGQATTDAGEPADSALPPARPLPQLGLSHLDSIEVLTGGAAATEELPLVIALHGLGDRPENFSKLFEGFEHKARFVFPRGPVQHGKGHAWMQATGSETEVSRVVKRSADKIAALADEIAARKATKGKAIVTGFSQGGIIAFTVAARQPERIGAIVPVGGWLPQFAWPDEERFARDRPVVRALNGADDQVTKAVDARRCVVKLRMLKLNASVRLYANGGHNISPAVKTDLFRMLSWLVAGTGEPPPCESCPGDSIDPEACSLCPGGQPDSETTEEEDEEQPSGAARPAVAVAPSAPSSAPSAPSSEAATKRGPDAPLERRALAPALASAGGRGALSREQIQGTFRRNMASIRYCYDRQVASQPELGGRVSVRFTIARDGSVSSASIASSTLGNTTVEECVRRAVTRVRFPQPQGGDVIVTYPFTFASTAN